MLIKLILLQFNAHLLGDYIFQPHYWTAKKGSNNISWYHLWHTIIIFFLTYLLSLDFDFLISAAILSMIHFTTDILKSILKSKYPWKESLLFFSDQLIHILTIIFISYIYYYQCKWEPVIDLELKFVAIFAGFIVCLKPINIIIKNIFIAFQIAAPVDKSKINEEMDLPNAGKLIGITERLLTLSLILMNQFGAVGLIIAAKSILRFKDNKKNEYVLVGTLLSFGMATLIGIILLNFFN